MEEIFLNVFGIRAHVSTPLHDFAEFVRQNYNCFLDDSGQSYDLEVMFSPDAGARAAADGRELYGAGMGAYIGSKTLYWENEFGFRTLLTLEDSGAFNILAYHHDLLREQDQEERYQNFQRSIRWAIHFPIFVLLQQRQGWGLVHAAAVAQKGDALLFCGLNKVGKSTLAMYLCQTRGFSFMTDNFLLAGPDKVYGFPETARMSPEATEHLGLTPARDHKVYGKFHIDIDPTDVCLEARPKVCFLVTRGKTLDLVRVDSSRAWQTLQGMHAFLGEFPEYSYLGLLPFLQHGAPVINPSPTAMFEEATWYHLSSPLDWNIEKMAETIERCI